jgi:hypothetical protein
MRRTFVIAILFLGLATPGIASDVEKSLESSWRGAWVVTAAETYSDCAGTHTNNRVNGNLVSSKGRFRFKVGELAKVEKVDAKRARVDILVSFSEPLLVSRQEGPFTLYNEVRCLVELEVELPRRMVADSDVAGIESALKPVLRKYVSQDEAQASKVWNHRKRDPYPPDYDHTLTEYAAWKAQQVNAAVQARIDRALEETSRLTDRVTGDADYLAGMAAGIESMRTIEWGECRDVMARDFSSLPRPTQQASLAGQSEKQARFGRGYQDGQRLVFGLESLRRLPRCFVSPPDQSAAASYPGR